MVALARVQVRWLREVQAARKGVAPMVMDDALSLREAAKGFTVSDPEADPKDDFDLLMETKAEKLAAQIGGDIYPHSATTEDYLKTVYVGWEILPPGTRDDTVTRILSTSRNPTNPEMKKRVTQRIEVFSRLKPQGFIRGSSGFARYFGAKFADDCVVFENLDYGNALYVMFGRWEELSRLSRTELLSSDREGFERIIHTDGWEEKLKRVLEMHRDGVFA